MTIVILILYNVHWSLKTALTFIVCQESHKLLPRKVGQVLSSVCACGSSLDRGRTYLPPWWLLHSFHYPLTLCQPVEKL